MEKIEIKAKAYSVMEKIVEKYDLNPNLLKYLKDGRVYYSYITAGGVMPGIDTVTYDPEYEKLIKDFEKNKEGAYVFHAIESITPYGKMLSLLFLDDDDDSVFNSNQDYIFAYVYNFDTNSGEYGDISIAGDKGALTCTDVPNDRTALTIYI